ncbi:MAG: dinitrogenase iron-molybdenum cofactor biosynthesis protein [Phycisphaerales bacterium]|nr:dinitrogenase iron-molybdenum cofactor biosynthesis protein [Phycisphaerales bacterium]
MKVAITAHGPNLTDEIDPRFDRAKFLVVVDTETEQCTAYGNIRCLGSPQDTVKMAAQRIRQLGIDTVLTGKVGDEVLAALHAENIRVRTVSSGQIKEALNAYQADPNVPDRGQHNEMYYWI